ncbi:MAG: hypothetical protein WC728_10525 [Elusimicrobiota bacterium]
MRTRLSLDVGSHGELSLEYQVFETLAGVSEDFCSDILSSEHPCFRQTVQCHLSTKLLSRVTFLDCVVDRMEASPQIRHIAHVRGHYAMPLLSGHYRRKNLELRSGPAFISGLFLIAGALRDLARSAIRGLFPPAPVSPRDLGGRQSVWIEKPPPAGVWKQFERFLVEHVRRRAYPIIYYFDRRDTAVDGKTGAALEEAGFGWVDARDARLLRLTPDICLEFCRRWSWLRAGGPWWLFWFKLRFLLLRCLHRDLYSRFQVKVLIQHQETSWIQGPQALAVEDAGGIMVGLHWSHYIHSRYVTHLTPQQAFLVWGRAHADMLRKKGHCCRHILPCGLWIDDSGTTPAANFRARLSGEVNFILGIFDDYVHYSDYNSIVTIVQFYRALLTAIERHPDYGGMIKSKGWDLQGLSHLPGGADIGDRISALLRDGRLLVLDPRSHAPPAVAAQCDLSVCYGLNSAGIVSALHGCRAIHWDCNGLLNHPICRTRGQRIVFQSLEEVSRRVEEAAAGDRGIGDFSSWRLEVDHFGDCGGLVRIVHFLDLFMGEAQSGVETGLACDRAVEAYRRSEGVSADFAKGKNWWDNPS